MNIRITRRAWLALALALATSTLAFAQDKPAIKPPPPASLHYTVRADVQGLTLDGESRIDWTWDAKRYSLALETRSALTGVLLADQSEGGFDRDGLAPLRYTARRFLKKQAVARFDRSAGEIDFAGDGPSYKLSGGEQDRISVLWQMMSMMRARPADFSPGSRWNFFVAGLRGGEPWTFEVKDRQRLRTPLGDLDTVHVTHLPEDKKSKTEVNVWFAPSQEWFPVRIRFSEPNGDYIEQTLDKLTRK